MDVASQLRKAVNDAIQSGTTRYSIAKGAGIEYATFAKWLDDHRDIRLSTVSSLASYLGLELSAADPLKAKDKVKAPALPAVDWGKAELKRKPRDEGRERRK